MEKHGDLIKKELAQRARGRGRLALVGPSSINKGLGIVERDLNAAIDIWGFAVLKKRPAELKRTNFVGQLLQAQVNVEKLKPIAGDWSRKTRKHLHISWRRFV
jgi:hypothetical protein